MFATKCWSFAQFRSEAYPLQHAPHIPCLARSATKDEQGRAPLAVDRRAARIDCTLDEQGGVVRDVEWRAAEAVGCGRIQAQAEEATGRRRGEQRAQVRDAAHPDGSGEIR